MKYIAQSAHGRLEWATYNVEEANSSHADLDGLVLEAILG